MRRQTPTGWLAHDLHNRGVSAWFVAVLLFLFYLVLYLGLDSKWFGTPWMDSTAVAIFRLVLPDTWVDRMQPNRWSLYGLLYTVAIGAGGAWMFAKYRHNRYQLVRTSVLMFVQVTLAFSVPHALKFFGQPDYYFSYIWPLKIDYLDPRNFDYYPLPFVIYSFAAALVLVPALTLLYGKRWYCSWVCGCGGLANTFGEPWRHLSFKQSWAWRFEKVSIHAVLVLAFVATAVWMLSAALPDHTPVGRAAEWFRRWYGLVVMTSLSGIAGVGLYPIGGTRVWCRFFCPMAALLGLIQKLGRFQIRAKKDMCISCGLCSKYCEMGIDVRSYAQSSESFTRASCVGCGLCTEVCPRGVLRLGNDRGRS